MGYTTDFTGEFILNKPLDPALKEYLIAFSDTRRMERIASKLPSPNYAPECPITGLSKEDRDVASDWHQDHGKEMGRYCPHDTWGRDGEYWAYGEGFMGQEWDASVIDGNRPPPSQPGLWCKWVPSADGDTIKWDGGEKFYYYTEWLEYIIKHFLAPFDYVLNGKVTFQGEEYDDLGYIEVDNNVVTVVEEEYSGPICANCGVGESPMGGTQWGGTPTAPLCEECDYD